MLLPVRRESAAADTRREYVWAWPGSGLQAGPLHSCCQMFVLAPGCPSVGPGKYLLVLGELTAVVPTLQAESSSLHTQASLLELIAPLSVSMVPFYSG